MPGPPPAPQPNATDPSGEPEPPVYTHLHARREVGTRTMVSRRSGARGPNNVASAWGIVLDVFRVQFGCASPFLEEVLQALVGVFRRVWVDWLHPKHGHSLGPHHTACLHANMNTQPVNIRRKARSSSFEASPPGHQVGTNPLMRILEGRGLPPCWWLHFPGPCECACVQRRALTRNYDAAWQAGCGRCT